MADMFEKRIDYKTEIGVALTRWGGCFGSSFWRCAATEERSDRVHQQQKDEKTEVFMR